VILAQPMVFIPPGLVLQRYLVFRLPPDSEVQRAKIGPERCRNNRAARVGIPCEGRRPTHLGKSVLSSSQLRVVCITPSRATTARKKRWHRQQPPAKQLPAIEIIHRQQHLPAASPCLYTPRLITFSHHTNPDQK